MQMHIDGAMKRLEREHNERAWAVWHGEALRRAKRLPKLEKLMVKRKSVAHRHWKEQMAIMDRWAAVMRRVERQKRL